ncbi:MAG TPA: ABC transporter permease [Chitinophagaceae bacterium]|jgi:ABC-2 type transport system permease protein|nr:ABC transporter permease [Chitinophagaceae bacterium]
MNKIWLIIQREYLSRVKKKSFLVTTLLVPILMAGLTFTMVFLAAKSKQKQAIAVIDESGIFKGKMDTSSSSYSIKYIENSKVDDNKALLEKNECDILVHIYPFKNNLPDSIHVYKDGGVSLSANDFISDDLNTIYQIKQLQDAGIDKAKIDSINESSIELKSFDLKSNKETRSEIAMIIGYGMGIIIYFVIFLYGVSVMRGVSEEKTNRIAEVIISSVKPFQLMMGKIIGIAFVGLTQFLLWLILTGLLQVFLPLFLPDLGQSMQPAGIADAQAQLQQVPQSEMNSFLQSLMSQNWTLIIGCFLFYFLGGYFLYAAMFAAVGSMVNEDQQEAQQMTFPITIPIIFGAVIMGSSINDPNSPLSIFGSLFPLTSPIVMMGRIPYGVPAWQLILSMSLLVLGFLGMTWLSAKIYRAGILMYGKKASWKEALKWIRQS